MELSMSNGRPDTNEGPNSCDGEPSDGDRKANEMKCASCEQQPTQDARQSGTVPPERTA